MHIAHAHTPDTTAIVFSYIYICTHRDNSGFSEPRLQRTTLPDVQQHRPSRLATDPTHTKNPLPPAGCARFFSAFVWGWPFFSLVCWLVVSNEKSEIGQDLKGPLADVIDCGVFGGNPGFVIGGQGLHSLIEGILCFFLDGGRCLFDHGRGFFLDGWRCLFLFFNNCDRLFFYSRRCVFLFIYHGDRFFFDSRRCVFLFFYHGDRFFFDSRRCVFLFFHHGDGFCFNGGRGFFHHGNRFFFDRGGCFFHHGNRFFFDHGRILCYRFFFDDGCRWRSFHDGGSGCRGTTPSLSATVLFLVPLVLLVLSHGQLGGCPAGASNNTGRSQTKGTRRRKSVDGSRRKKNRRGGDQQFCSVNSCHFGM
mmetsp:Transcript_9715/g.20320  ORF Transcript_9715/g.20320 Transcript_9715/m.20320 type:complete len:362 (-) Transcript_9715:82-1167(-)